MKRIFIIAFGIASLLALIAGAIAYYAIFNSNTLFSEGDKTFFIHDQITTEKLADDLLSQSIIKRKSSFKLTAKLMSFDSNNVKTGRYKIEAGLNNREIISMIRSGRQEAVKLTFNNVRDIKELSGRITSNIQLDSIEFVEKLLSKDFLDKLEYNEQDILSLFIPNTYQVFWNIDFESLINRMKKEHNIFWNEDRLAKAAELDLSPKEVYALASIVEKETIANSEKKRIAGVYYNRLERNMLLQADPTVVYANGDFSLRRVLNKHLEIDSPYNTYKYLGLPPGPIYMPDINSIEAVLNREKHKYIFFCAKPDNSGLHAFAETSAQHAANARRFHSWLNKQRIYK